MDRNCRYPACCVGLLVALRKESVDRNALGFGFVFCQVRSLSARRAWIEIALLVNGGALSSVALRKESVDRNVRLLASLILPLSSLSARRAWIEMIFPLFRLNSQHVALRKESVDRNPPKLLAISVFIRRSPQGERG